MHQKNEIQKLKHKKNQRQKKNSKLFDKGSEEKSFTRLPQDNPS